MFNDVVKGWSVFEDYHKHIYLIVESDHGNIIYYNYGYEQRPGDLSSTIALLEIGENPKMWNDNKISEYGIKNQGPAHVVADRFYFNDYPTFHWEYMGETSYNELSALLGEGNRKGGFGKFVKRKRLSQGKSVYDMEKEGGITHRTVENIENGKYNPRNISFATVVLMSKYLKFPIEVAEKMLIVELYESGWYNGEYYNGRCKYD